METEKRVCCKHLRMGPRHFIKKYLWTAQHLSQSGEAGLQKDDTKRSLSHTLLTKYRRVLAFIIPGAFFHFMWWGYFIYNDTWFIFETKYKLSITMIFGSMIAGMTSVGGGAVAFPVMTLAFEVAPYVSRDVVLMFQSCGMSAAAFSILFMQVQIDWYSLIFCSLGGIAGLLFGFMQVDPVLTPPAKKMGFVSIWFAFGSVLAILNLQRKRKTYSIVQEVKLWKLVVLFVTGFCGGIFTSVAGSGLDICSFSVMTLMFRISERVATPTSVILMAFNSIIGFYWRGLVLNEITIEAYSFWAAVLPIVVIGAPIGSVLGSHMHRLVLAGFVNLLVLVSLISAFILVPQTPVLIGASVATIVASCCFFAFLTYLGHRIHLKDDEEEEEVRDTVDNKALENAMENGHSNPAFDGDKEHVTNF